MALPYGILQWLCCNPNSNFNNVQYISISQKVAPHDHSLLRIPNGFSTGTTAPLVASAVQSLASSLRSSGKIRSLPHHLPFYPACYAMLSAMLFSIFILQLSSILIPISGLMSTSCSSCTIRTEDIICASKSRVPWKKGVRNQHQWLLNLAIALESLRCFEARGCQRNSSVG